MSDLGSSSLLSTDIVIDPAVKDFCKPLTFDWMFAKTIFCGGACLVEVFTALLGVFRGLVGVLRGLLGISLVPNLDKSTWDGLSLPESTFPNVIFCGRACLVGVFRGMLGISFVPNLERSTWYGLPVPESTFPNVIFCGNECLWGL